ncbi:MAG TPA: MotA/TolQ/ExbB proton channel family protein [Myxococcales bacterium]|nr:MotA/TolQ/ExbB proton channel family protein [Myxococcales bacterium]
MIAERLLAFTLLGAGWVLWLLLILSVLSVAVMIERALYFARRRMSKTFPDLLKLCQGGELAKAAALATGDAMEAEVVRTAATVADGGNEAVEKAVQSTIDRRRLEYEQWLFVLGTLGNNAPFIGLFGTVLGIIRAFADLAAANKAGGSSTASYVMAGISEALVATAVGLFVAIPAVLAFNIFQRLLKRVIGRSNALGNAISSGLHFKGK